MPCYHPRTVWWSKRCLSKNGKRRFFFKRPKMFYDESFKSLNGLTLKEWYDVQEETIPGCRPKCVGCQEDYSKSWAIRCLHESRCHSESCFLTLTYNEKFIPKKGLCPEDLQKFIKRLRFFVSADAQQAGTVQIKSEPARGRRVRFYACGEYGSKLERPHYHLCVFGYDFPDKELWSVRNNVKLYRSKILEKLWADPKTKESYGFSTIGEVTIESASYIARYCQKKKNKNDSENHYQGKNPEFVRMSLKPGIGKDWLVKYKDSVYPDDYVLIKPGVKAKAPRYYDKVYDSIDHDQFTKIKAKRIERAKASSHNSPERLRAREKIKTAQMKQLKRGFENGT